MESINYTIQKFSDTYLLPAVASTIIALIYFSYKLGRRNLSIKPLAMFNTFYFGKDAKCEPENSEVLIEPNLPITVLKPTTVSTATLTQSRNKSRSKELVPMKWNAVLKNEIANLHASNLVRNESMYAYPVYKVWSKSEWSMESNNLTKENEPLWDYYNMNCALQNLSFKEKNFINKTLEDKFDYKDNKDDGIETQNIFSSELSVDSIKKSRSCSGTINPYKQPRVSHAKYYRMCYDIEDEDTDSYGFDFNEIPSNQDNAKSFKESVSVITASNDDSSSSNRNILEESQIVSVDLKSSNCSQELFKNECPSMDLEKDTSKREHYENYWEIV